MSLRRNLLMLAPSPPCEGLGLFSRCVCGREGLGGCPQAGEGVSWCPTAWGGSPKAPPCPVPAPCPALTSQEAPRGLHSSHQDINKLLGHKAQNLPLPPQKAGGGTETPVATRTHPCAHLKGLNASLLPPCTALHNEGWTTMASLGASIQRAPPVLLGEFWEGDQAPAGATGGV